MPKNKLSAEQIVRERAKIIIVMTADDASARERIIAAASAYKQRFRQKSVAIVTGPVCAGFQRPMVD
jgi:hypothetical protein